jgi:hypothetical protein
MRCVKSFGSRAKPKTGNEHTHPKDLWFWETNERGLEMSEDWLADIVRDLKVKNHDAAELAASERQRWRLVAQSAPAFWRSFSDFLRKFVEEIRDIFGDDITAGEIKFERKPANEEIAFSKSAFPYLRFQAKPDFSGLAADVRYSKAETQPEENEPRPRPENVIPCRFELNAAGAIVMHLNGREYSEPEQAARFIIEKLFS